MSVPTVILLLNKDISPASSLAVQPASIVISLIPVIINNSRLIVSSHIIIRRSSQRFIRWFRDVLLSILFSRKEPVFLQLYSATAVLELHKIHPSSVGSDLCLTDKAVRFHYEYRIACLKCHTLASHCQLLDIVSRSSFLIQCCAQTIRNTSRSTDSIYPILILQHIKCELLRLIPLQQLYLHKCFDR